MATPSTARAGVLLSMVGELRRRGVKLRTFKAAQLRVALPRELPRDHRQAKALYIPYWTVRGQLSGFHRVRFFPPIMLASGVRVSNGNGNGHTNGTNGHAANGLVGLDTSRQGGRGLDTSRQGGRGLDTPRQGRVGERGGSGPTTTKLRPSNLKSKPPRVMRYWQPTGSDPHLYVPPPDLVPTKVWTDTKRPLIVTEGEFKALASCQAGFPAVAVAGINAWLRRVAQPNSDGAKDGSGRSSAKGTGGNVTTKGSLPKSHLPKSGANAKKSRTPDGKVHVAEELETIAWRGRRVWIIFDTEPETKPKTRVAIQEAAFSLGIWLEQQGADVRHVKLPQLDAGGKTGLDDFLVSEGPYALRALLADEREWRFPEKPNLIPWLAEQMDRGRLKPSQELSVCRAVLADMDARGVRYHGLDGSFYYYFDNATRVLHQYNPTPAGLRAVPGSSLGKLLYSRYKLGINDRRIVEPLIQRSTIWHPSVPIKQAHSVSRTTHDALFYQLDDSRLVKVTRNDIAFVPNGTDDMLFLPGRVEALAEHAVVEAIEHSGFRDRWRSILRRTNILPMPGMTLEQTHDFLACLFYLNPWFRRWRGLMLPVEAAIAEAGSGKTFLYNLRRGILTGSASLDHAPDTTKDWYASVAVAPGLWVCDNMGEVRRDVRDKVADEITRLVTDPDPHIDLRQLFSDNVNVRFPVDSTFAITSIYTAFYKADIVQRSVLIEMRAIPVGQRDAYWYQRELADRAGWVAEHLLAAQKFLRVAHHTWDPQYLSQSRLAHFDQAIITMGTALGFGRENMVDIVSKLAGATSQNIARSDPVMEALRDFAHEVVVPATVKAGGKIVQCRVNDIVEWVQTDPASRYMHIKYLQNPVQLGKYIRSHQADIESITGLRRVTQNNQAFLRVVKPPLPLEGERTS